MLRVSCHLPRSLLSGFALFVLSNASLADIVVSPSSVVLDRPESSQQLLVCVAQADRTTVDVSRSATYEIAEPRIAAIDSSGLVHPLRDGRTEIIIRHSSEVARVPLEVRRFTAPEPVSFHNEIVPLLTKARCNAGGCHGKAEGQNGFKLSIFGFDAATDFAAIVKEGRGRRVSVTAPERSLLLRKGAAEIPHGGGRKIEPDSYQYARLKRWIAEGAGFDDLETQSNGIVAIEVEPLQQSLLAGDAQQLRVTSVDREGNRRCVTAEADYESNAASIAEVNQRGLVEASDIPGEAAILVRYLGHVAVSRITLPRPDVEFQRPSEHNFIDRLVWDKLQRLGIEPGELADDATFLRRVYLDTIGTLPTPLEVREFLADSTSAKRTRLIDQLLERDEYVDYWTTRWLDILRADQLQISPQGTVAMQRWLRRQFRENRSFDEFARELLTVQGSTTAEGPAAFYKILNKPDEASRAISQLLLGVRIECAQCHHHPSERWSQTDYVGLAGFFTGVKLKKLPNGNEAVVSLGGSDLPHPRTGETIAARPLGDEPADFSAASDRRIALAAWMTSDSNPFFAKAIANRLWAHYFGRGLVEPIDDMRDTNPASNEPLMAALTEHMREVRYDLKAFTRTLLQSRAYQLSARSNDSNADDFQNFSHASYKALPAEVLLDAISQSTNVPEKFNGWPEGYRAIQVWDNRMPSYFFRIFGRPVRASVCECERSGEPSIAQSLHLLNSPEIMAKVQHRHGKSRELASSDLTPAAIIDELYLGMLSRLPTGDERTLMLQAFDGTDVDRRAAVEDVQWALLNSKEFMFNH
ncbi:MAG TPA: DUF1549 and DUF1553 domain-containing protein [Pirellulaceae bacterium]|nr:DUF1549 and DUF1553 domain-containing protein [Pirellulaceae bacterium]